MWWKIGLASVEAGPLGLTQMLPAVTSLTDKSKSNSTAERQPLYVIRRKIMGHGVLGHMEGQKLRGIQLNQGLGGQADKATGLGV